MILILMANVAKTANDKYIRKWYDILSGILMILLIMWQYNVSISNDLLIWK